MRIFVTRPNRKTLEFADYSSLVNWLALFNYLNFFNKRGLGNSILEDVQVSGYDVRNDHVTLRQTIMIYEDGTQVYCNQLWKDLSAIGLKAVTGLDLFTLNGLRSHVKPSGSSHKKVYAQESPGFRREPVNYVHKHRRFSKCWRNARIMNEIRQVQDEEAKPFVRKRRYNDLRVCDPCRGFERSWKSQGHYRKQWERRASSKREYVACYLLTKRNIDPELINPIYDDEPMELDIEMAG